MDQIARESNDTTGNANYQVSFHHSCRRLRRAATCLANQPPHSFYLTRPPVTNDDRNDNPTNAMLRIYTKNVYMKERREKDSGSATRKMSTLHPVDDDTRLMPPLEIPQSL